MKSPFLVSNRALTTLNAAHLKTLGEGRHGWGPKPERLREVGGGKGHGEAEGDFPGRGLSRPGSGVREQRRGRGIL